MFGLRLVASKLSLPFLSFTDENQAPSVDVVFHSCMDKKFENCALHALRWLYGKILLEKRKFHTCIKAVYVKLTPTLCVGQLFSIYMSIAIEGICQDLST